MSSQQWMNDTLRLDVECGPCGFEGVADGWEDPEAHRWGWDCPSCDWPHTYRYDDRGALSVKASVYLFLTAMCALGFWLWQPVLFWTVIALTVYAALCLAIIAVVVGGNTLNKENEQ